MIYNIRREKYVEGMLNISLHKAKLPFKHNGLALPVVHARDIPVLHSHITVMSKYSNAKFQFSTEKFFTFALRSW